MTVAFAILFGFCLFAFTNGLLVDEIRRKFLNLEDDLWSFVLQSNGEYSEDPGLFLVKEFAAFDKQIQTMPQDLLYGMSVPRQADKFLLLYADLSIIHDMYEKFRRYQTDFLSTSKTDYTEFRRETTTTDIIDDILNDVKNNVNQTVRRVYNSTFGNNDSEKSLLDEVYWIMFNSPCENPTQSAKQVFYNLYNTIALIDLKGYLMSQFAYMALRFQEIGNHTEASLKARDEFKTRTNKTYTNVRGFMKIASGKIYRCDPKMHVEGQTYEQITQLLQAQIQNEVDLNPAGTCTDTCNGYSDTQNYGCYDKTSEYCRLTKPCIGRIHDCRFIESHMKACVSPSHSHRKYEFIQYDGGRLLGEKTRCAQRTINSWFRWFVHCSYCLCFCDQQGPMSDRYFNLRQVEADTENNRVITGIRLKKHNRIFHIQIQEGKLLPYGYIDQNTTRWVPIDKYKISDYGTKEGIDYKTLTYHSRSLYLDDLKVPDNTYVITGIRFDSSIKLKITITPFNFTTGELFTDRSYDAVQNHPRMKIDISNSDIPTKSPPSKPTDDWFSDAGTYVDFTYTDLDKDAAQTTVPFIDIQPAYVDPAVPLKSAGLYLKNRPGYGGFVGVKVNTYDYENNMNFVFPDAKEREDNGDAFAVMAN